ncbi:MAG: hypothetical protein JWO19_3363 [Bryobacterales bacterium]|nr:hypothetical protein [Bryobacterales bacterium]
MIRAKHRHSIQLVHGGHSDTQFGKIGSILALCVGQRLGHDLHVLSLTDVVHLHDGHGPILEARCEWIGGATTLNVDTLGPAAVKLTDGITNPAPGDIMAGRVYEIWYDGTSFRLLNPFVPPGVLAEVRPACGVAVRDDGRKRRSVRV